MGTLSYPRTKSVMGARTDHNRTYRGIIDRVGPSVNHLKIGDRVVVSFQIACGTCRYCQQKLSSFCDKTNDSSVVVNLWGQRDSAFFGYSHLSTLLSYYLEMGHPSDNYCVR